MRACCVEGCVVPSEDIIFFEFPTSRTLRQRWLDVVTLSGKLTSDSMICSQHFMTTDYELIRGKTRLKRKIVPSLLLTAAKKSSEPLSSPITCSDKSAIHEPQSLTEKSDASQPLSPLKCPEQSDKCQTPPSPIKCTKDVSDKRNETSSPDKSVRCETLPHDEKCSDESHEIKSDMVSLCDVSGKLHPPLVPEDIEEELNKLDEEKRKSEALRRKSESLSKLSKGLSKISERLSRISESLNRTNDVGRTEDLTNGNSCDGIVSTNERVSGQGGLKDTLHTTDLKQTDIEEMITNYHIKNKIPNNALAVDLKDLDHERREGEKEREGSRETVEIGEVPDLESDAPPVFIEISVGNDVRSQQGAEDCLMLLESVQCEVDPATLMLPEPEDDITLTSDDDEPPPARKEDPISLLTSSDDDEVIIEEPHIDTVEVSDETDEDDVPLVKLVKTPKKKDKRPPPTKKEDFFARVMWGGDEFFCMQCQFTCTDRREFRLHRESHSTVLQVCSICSYTTASKAQYKRHARTHKGEKRFKCHLCEYKARHNMSLIYHLKTHNASTAPVKGGRGYKCKKCDFRADLKTVVLKHLKTCSGNVFKYKCGDCDYETARKSDMRRHKSRKHKDDADDEDYWP